MVGKLFQLKILVFCSTLAVPALAQSPHHHLRKGDSEYDLEHYKDAEKHYREAADLNYGDPVAAYNLGNALYQQGKWEDAAVRFEQVARSSSDKTLKADALHNLGNAQLKQHKFKEAIEAYENSLRLRPGDADTKQNLQMAKKKLKEEQQRQQQELQNQEQNQQQNQQKQQSPQDEKNDPQQNQEQSQDQPQQPNQGQPQQQQKPDNQQKLKKEEARRLLETAIGPEDQKNARKYRELRNQPKSSGKEKDW
ncbi:MAG: tetratricopeptide repeat protein [Saprospiraceae bacterium]